METQLERRGIDFKPDDAQGKPLKFRSLLRYSPATRVAPRGDRCSRLDQPRSGTPLGRIRVPLFRILPVLTLVLGTLSLFHATPAQAQNIWSATLTVTNVAEGFSVGCDTDDGNTRTACSSTSVLTDNDFTVGGTSFEIYSLHQDHNNNRVELFFANTNVATALDSYSFYVDAKELPFASGTHVLGGNSVEWPHPNNWKVGDKVSLRIGPPIFATLTSLTGSTSTDGTNFGGTLTLNPTFEPYTINYTARVPAAVTHVRLTADADFSAYDVKAAKPVGAFYPATDLDADSPSADFALNPGTTELQVIVTAITSDLNQQIYTINVAGGSAPVVPRDPGGDDTDDDDTGGDGTGGGGGDSGDDPDDSGDDGQSDDNPANRASELEATSVRAKMDLAIDLSDTFNDLNGEAPVYTVGSSDESVTTVEVDGGMLTVNGIERGSAEITVVADYADGESISRSFIVTVTGPAMIWYLPSASNEMRQGFVRIVNHFDTTGVATITATDDAGQTYVPLMLTLEPRQAMSVNADDLETGNSDKGLTGATGMGMGDWRLTIDSETLDIEALAYAHTEEGFLSGMNAVATLTDDSVEIPFFNPGSNVDQVSLLRLVNTSDEEAEATVTGVDDNGASPGASILLTLAAGAACTVDAAQLESGEGLACGESQDGLGDGHGHWRLTVASAAPVVAMNLLSSQAGHLTNLSATASPDEDDMWHVHLFPAANNEHARQGVVRIINRSSAEGNVSIAASDDSDMAYEALSLSIGGNKAAHLDSDDLELGNEDKDLTGATGSGMGAWRLALSSDTIDINANAYVRTSDGLLTAMNTTAPQARDVSRVAFFNSGDDDSMSVLRLVNESTDDATVTIDGTDDLGLRPGMTVRVLVPATDAVELTASQLESGEADAITSGALGDGTGRWRLRVNGAVTVLGLLSSPTGHLTNLSHVENSRLLRSLPAALLAASETVTLEIAAERQLRGRWSEVEGARYDVDVLRNGKRETARSMKNTRSTAIRWWFNSPPGTYTIRVRSVNADGVRGPWSALSNEITFD